MVQVEPSRLWRTSYDVISEPPSPGSDHDTPKLPSPATSNGAAGASGTVNGTPVAESDHSPAPAVFTARTCTRYAMALSNDDTV